MVLFHYPVTELYLQCACQNFQTNYPAFDWYILSFPNLFRKWSFSRYRIRITLIYCVKGVHIRSFLVRIFLRSDGELLCESPYYGQRRDNVDQKNSKYIHFLGNDYLWCYCYVQMKCPFDSGSYYFNYKSSFSITFALINAISGLNKFISTHSIFRMCNVTYRPDRTRKKGTRKIKVHVP